MSSSVVNKYRGVFKSNVASFLAENHVLRVLQAIDIVDVVGSYVSLKPKGKEMVGLCPFHDDRRPSMSVSPAKQIFKCFACGAGGDAIKFMMLREHLSFREALCLLAERGGVELPRLKSRPEGQADRGELEKVNRWAARFFRSQFEDAVLGKRARDYVEQRGITEELARRFGLGWAADSWENLNKAAQQGGPKVTDLLALGLLVERQSDGGGTYDRFRERLMFPVIDAMGRVIGFGGRTLGDDPAKYLNSPESVLFDKSRTIYGLNGAKDSIVRERRAVVVEGYTDCIMAHQFGVTNVVATLGTSLTEEHARMLSRYADRIVLIFDSDQAGQKAADRAVDIFLAQRVEISLVSLPEEKDPCDFLLARGREAFTALIENATDALEYKWQVMLKRVDACDTVEGRRKATEEFLLVVTKASEQGNLDGMAEGFLLNRVARLVNQPVSVVHERVRALRKRLGRTERAGEVPKVGQRSMTSSSYVNAQREILEVLLNRPDLYEQAAEVIGSPEEFEDEILQAVARRVWEYGRQQGQGPLSEILAACESVELCKIMTDMAGRGEQRGNYEMTLAKALENVEHVRAERARGEIRQMVSTAADKYGDDAETAMLMELHAKWQPNTRRPGAY